MKRFIFVGLGLHARRIQYKTLCKFQKKYNISVPLLIDLEDKRRQIEDYLKDKSLQPENILYLKSTKDNILGRKLAPEAIKSLEAITREKKIDGIIVVTEPKAHKIYIDWACKHKINILVDKPITAPIDASTKIEKARSIESDFMEILEKVRKAGNKCYVMVQRRRHAGYELVHSYLENFVKEFQIPISYIDSYFADGTLTLPNEFEKENHPYKYGYGKLMHSGYHSIDILSWFLEINKHIPTKKPNKASIYALRFAPNDFFHQLQLTDYNKLFGKSSEIEAFFKNYKDEQYREYGELDVFLLAQFKHDDKVVTTSTVVLQQNSFSRRAWLDLPEDTYKKNGRLRHERQSIQVGNLLNIQIHTYQSYEVFRPDVKTTGVGNEHHFDIYFFRNSGLVGGQTLEKIEYGEKLKKDNKEDKYFMGHNEKGKENIIRSFIEGAEDITTIENQMLTNSLLSKTAEALALGIRNQTPLVNFELEL